MMIWGLWSEKKALVGHRGGSGVGGQKKWAAGKGRVALWEGQGSPAVVREEAGDGSRKVVGDEVSSWP